MFFRRLLVAWVFIAVGLGVLADPVLAQSSRTVTRTFDLDSDGAVELDTFTGGIEVTGTDDNEVEVVARIEGEDAELVESTALQFDASDSRLSVEVDYDEVEASQKFLGLFSFGNVDRPGVFFEIRMPRSARLTVDDFSSEISVSGLKAGVTVEAFSSPVVIQNSEGRFDVETYSGSVEGSGLRGGVRVETFSGDTRLQMEALTANSSFESFSGDVDVVLPADAGFELVSDDDSFGDVESEFAFTVEDGRRIVGGGGPRIEMETFSGTIRLRKQ